MGQSRLLYRFILLPSFVGLACYACAPAPNSKTASDSSLESLNGALNQDLASDDLKKSESTPTGEAFSASSAPMLLSSTAYRDGINLASGAYSLSQSAVSPDDWSLIASRWQQAVEQLKLVNSKDKNYAIAQQKIVEYIRNADHATAQFESLQQSIDAPVPPRWQRLPRESRSAPKIQLPIKTATNSSDTAEKVSVPVIRRLHGTPVVQVLFNGEQSYEMILDTGASRTLITQQMADALGVVATERMVAATASENEVTFDLGRMRSMSLGEVMLQNAQVSIGESIEIGLLGNDFLKGYDITIREDTVELTTAD